MIERFLRNVEDDYLDCNSFFRSILVSDDAAPDLAERSFAQAPIRRVNSIDVDVRQLLDLHVDQAIRLAIENVSVAHDEVVARLHVVDLSELD